MREVLKFHMNKGIFKVESRDSSADSNLYKLLFIINDLEVTGQKNTIAKQVNHLSQ